jgi:hypothetical protein
MSASLVQPESPTEEVDDPGPDLVEELEPMAFGEFLVERGVLSRSQLYQALREQDRHPGVRLGEIVAYLGFAPYGTIDRLLTDWSNLPVVEVALTPRPFPGSPHR